jgi:hypothetical protein
MRTRGEETRESESESDNKNIASKETRESESESDNKNIASKEGRARGSLTSLQSITFCKLSPWEMYYNMSLLSRMYLVR